MLGKVRQVRPRVLARIARVRRAHDLELTEGVVAEIGCGPGGILKVFQEKGYEVRGCELDRRCVEFSNKQGVPTLGGGVEALADAGIRADLVILSHLLEHLHDRQLHGRVTVRPE